MTQLYLVGFRCDLGDAFDVGRCIVSGDNEDDAISRVQFHLSIDATHKPTFSVTKLKPQIYQLERADVPKIVDKRRGDDDRPRGFRADYLVSIGATVAGRSEVAAIKRLAHHLLAKSSNDRVTDAGVSDLEMSVDAISNFGNELKRPFIEKQSVYSASEFYGGARHGLTGRGGGNA